MARDRQRRCGGCGRPMRFWPATQEQCFRAVGRGCTGYCALCAVSHVWMPNSLLNQPTSTAEWIEGTQDCLEQAARHAEAVWLRVPMGPDKDAALDILYRHVQLQAELLEHLRARHVQETLDALPRLRPQATLGPN